MAQASVKGNSHGGRQSGCFCGFGIEFIFLVKEMTILLNDYVS
jgi:hypothetical protein